MRPSSRSASSSSARCSAAGPCSRPAARVVDFALLAFLGWNVVAFVWSTDRHQSLFGERYQYQGLLTLGLYAGGFLLARLAFGDRRLRTRLFAAVTVGAVLVAGYALVQEIGLDPIWHGYLPAGRVFSSLGQSNSLAAYLVLAIPIAAFFARRTPGVPRPVTAGRGRGLAAMTLALAFTYSRAATSRCS